MINKNIMKIERIFPHATAACQAIGAGRDTSVMHQMELTQSEYETYADSKDFAITIVPTGKTVTIEGGWETTEVLLTLETN